MEYELVHDEPDEADGQMVDGWVGEVGHPCLDSLGDFPCDFLDVVWREYGVVGGDVEPGPDVMPAVGVLALSFTA